MNQQRFTPHGAFNHRDRPIAPLLHCKTHGADAKRFFINGSELSVVERGKGEPIVFVHGPLADYRAWHQQLESLSGGYRAISYSRRDHYPNSIVSNPEDYRPATHVADLASLIENFEISPVHLIGRSHGAAIAALLTHQRPELVRSLTLAEPALFSLLTNHNDQVAISFLRIALDVVRKMAEAEEMNIALEEYVRIVYGKDVLSQLPDWVQLMFGQNLHTLAPTLLAHFETTGFDRAAARRIKCPVLIINGESSPRLNRAICRQLNTLITNAQLLTLPMSSHGLQLDNPGGFNDAISKFLSGFVSISVN